MKPRFILLFILPVFLSCKGQPPDWSNSSHWKLYQAEGQQVFYYTVEKMIALPHKDVPSDSIQPFLKQTAPIPKDHTPVWMGAWLASYESADGKMHKVEIASHGNFFYDQSSGIFYAVPRELSRNWQTFIHSNVP